MARITIHSVPRTCRAHRSIPRPTRQPPRTARAHPLIRAHRLQPATLLLQRRRIIRTPVVTRTRRRVTPRRTIPAPHPVMARTPPTTPRHLRAIRTPHIHRAHPRPTLLRAHPLTRPRHPPTRRTHLRAHPRTHPRPRPRLTPLLLRPQRVTRHRVLTTRATRAALRTTRHPLRPIKSPRTASPHRVARPHVKQSC